MVFYMSTPKNKYMKNHCSDITKNGEEEIKKEFTKKLAKHIKKVRKEKGITQEDLAFESGLNSAYIGHLERGVYSPTLYVVWKISKALGISLQDFLANFS